MNSPTRINALLATVKRRSRTVFAIIASRGLLGLNLLLAILLRRFFKLLMPKPTPLSRTNYPTVIQSASSIFTTRVLIIATQDLPPQCEKYRVRQKRTLLKLRGFECTVLPMADYRACLNAIQTHTIVIFYRVPGYETVLAMIREAKRLGIPAIYETDDLIFSRESYLENQNIYRLSDELRHSVLDGVPLFLRALEQCDFGIASTPDLAAKMQHAGLKAVHVIENGIDDETLEIVNSVEQHRIRDSEHIRVFYGSGSKAHDTDFECAASSVLALAKRDPRVRLRIVGELTLPKEFDAIGPQIERYPPTDYASYLALLAACDFNLAPLEPSEFNDCKSNIKFIEAALFGIPSICSPRSAFRTAIASGTNGLLAETADEWSSSLNLLAASSEARATMGILARQTVLDRYSPSMLAERDIQQFIDSYTSKRRSAFRVLPVNVYFSPDSFGGGTIVAEETATRLAAQSGTALLVFSSSLDTSLEPYEVVRHEQRGLPVVSIRLPKLEHAELTYFNRKVKAIFHDLLRAFRPDVVHLHSVQGLGATLAEACLDEEIPYVITLHDAWWLCERQFMVKPDNQYCGQSTIDMKICENCVHNIGWTEIRLRYLKGVLGSAAKLLAPSQFWKDIYLANGVASDKIAVNKNGIRKPTKQRQNLARLDLRLRFGFVGGMGPIKGFELILKAFNEIKSTNYDLLVVDNTLNLGFSSITAKAYRVPGTIKIVPSYTQDTIDAFFSGIDVLLFPSQWKESFGLTVREALVRDKWVILTDSGGTVEDIVDGENGNIIPLDGKHEKLRDAIADLLSDPQKVISHVNRHKGEVRSFEDQTRELHSLLKDIVSNHSSKKTPATSSPKSDDYRGLP